MPNQYRGLVVPPAEVANLKRRYSVTQDVVGYRRCARQYGAFNTHNYKPAHQMQFYFGTVLHQVLDRCHGHYNGLVDPATTGTIPDDGAILSDGQIWQYFGRVRDAYDNDEPRPESPSELIGYFMDVEDGLRSQGIHAMTSDSRVQIIRILQYFNALEGQELYARVRDTELRLQADQQTHILHGVVDLLVEEPGNEDPGECEIWDYKGMSRMGLLRVDLETYMFQMRVYAHLYNLKYGVLPKRVVLYFLGELDGDRPPETRPVNATLSLDIHEGLSAQEIEDAIQVFNDTVLAIEHSKEYEVWSPATPGEIRDQDCAICDLRWDCETPNNGRGVAMRYP